MKNLLLIAMLFIVWQATAQVSINNDNSAPDPSAMLDVKSTTRGLLPPRMTHAEMEAIVNPVDGLIIYCTDCGTNGSGAFFGRANGAWTPLSPCGPPASPGNAAAQPALDQIIWQWNSVPGATGYKWSTENNYESALDLQGALSRTEPGLTCNTSYTRYVWAYGDCGNSTPTTLTAITSDCSATCGQSLTINHTTGGGVAPVNKSTSYGTVINVPGEPSKCWITSNLGSDHQATSVTDNTEPSAGWYWQFNRKQGRKFTSTTNPTPTWTINSISENSDWLLANDPCRLELGGNWRIPTNMEWNNVYTSGGWTNYNGPWNSPLKLHCGGWVNISGTLNDRGGAGVFWTSAQSSNSDGNDLVFTSGSFSMQTGIKAEGFTIRCLRDTITCPPTPPASPTTGIHGLGMTSITWTWNSVACASGYKWSATNDFATATEMGGAAMKTETGLTANTAYTRYVWAYNGYGPSPVLIMTATTNAVFICGENLYVNHVVSNGVAPVDKATTYGTVTNIPGENTKCWITKNLGSTQQATFVNDATEASAGWYWQFNCMQGYKHDGSTRTPNTIWITSINENSDWQSASDPCTLELGATWRLPTYYEWNNVYMLGNWTNWYGPWDSGLKLHAAGYLLNSSGSLYPPGSLGFYWSSTQYSTDHGWGLDFFSSVSYMYYDGKANGFSVRCLRD